MRYRLTGALALLVCHFPAFVRGATPFTSSHFIARAAQTQAAIRLVLVWAAPVLALCVVLLLYRLRHMSTGLRRRMKERASEREQAACEINDTLLQDFHGIVLLFQMASDMVGAQEPARSLLDEALQQADKVLVTARERVMNFRAFSTEDLAQAFYAAGDELRKRSPAEYRVIVHGDAVELNPVLRDEVYRIGREAITNAFRHAHASTIETEIFFKANELHLIFRDDGDGIDQSVVSGSSGQGYRGLTGMRERAAGIGARLKIWSRPRSGTGIELWIPAAVAYVTRQKRSCFQRLREFRQNAGEPL